MIYIGIDPGKQGAIAALNHFGKVIECQPTPLVRSTKARDEYDLAGIRDYLRAFGRDPSPLFVTVEKGQPMPPTVPGGSVANFARGVARGWEWMLVALEIPYQLVAPITWQKVMHAGTPGSDTKQRSIMAAQRLFPGVRLQRTERSKKPHDGIAEALLLAEFGRRVHQGIKAPEPECSCDLIASLCPVHNKPKRKTPQPSLLDF